MSEETKEKWRANYVPAPHFYNLNQAVVLLDRAFAGYDHYGTYLVGSSLERRDFRDVDVRMIMSDAGYDRLFGNGTDWTNPLWSLLCTTLSAWLSQQSGLPIDFQIQRQTQANELHGKPKKRSALGIFLDYPGERPTDIAKTEGLPLCAVIDCEERADPRWFVYKAGKGSGVRRPWRYTD